MEFRYQCEFCGLGHTIRSSARPMYAVVIDTLSGFDTGTPSGWIATNALMAAADPRFADEFWEAVEERGGLHR